MSEEERRVLEVRDEVLLAFLDHARDVVSKEARLVLEVRDEVP